ncbi:MAG: hypothetical protein J1F01_07605 [Oscillospiraceae bacterium]|nr:hypothetical protein [Oscillospiraceae bacterium]
MKCEVCGFINSDAKQFCSRCGNKVGVPDRDNLYSKDNNVGKESLNDATEGYKAVKPRMRNSLYKEMQQESRRKNRRTAMIINIMLTVIVLIIVINTIYICVKRADIFVGDEPAEESVTTVAPDADMQNNEVSGGGAIIIN